MQRSLCLFRNAQKLINFDSIKRCKTFPRKSRPSSSSQKLNDSKMTSMESSKETLNSDNTLQDSTRNVTYAQVLAKNASNANNVSNNNPNPVAGVLNGNENMNNIDEEPATSELDKSSKLDLSDLSQSDSYEDAEDNQTVNSSVSFKSSDFDSATVEEASSVVTADTTDSKVVNENSGSQSSEYSESDEEDLDDEAIVVDELYPSAMKWRFRSNEELDLPETVTVLETRQGSKVFIVGTAHFSKESQEDVAKTIRAVQPDVVMLELCKSRASILSLDEETILQESKNMNFQKMKTAIQQNGFLQGTLYLLLLNMSASLTKQLGMAPGGEFRRAFVEARNVPGCLVLLGDRPIHVTLQRALATLSWWKKLRIAWYMLRHDETISKEEVERCKQKDLLEEMLAEMTGEFPELSHVFVKERDIYLTYSLQMASVPVPCSNSSQETVCPSYVVGVVGIGHVPGIKENWEKISEKDIAPILVVPEASLSSKVMRITMRCSILGLILYGAYKICPKSWIPTGQIVKLFKN